MQVPIHVYNIGAGVTKPIFSAPGFFRFFTIVKTRVTYRISRTYLAGVAGAKHGLTEKWSSGALVTPPMDAIRTVIPEWNIELNQTCHYSILSQFLWGCMLLGSRIVFFNTLWQRQFTDDTFKCISWKESFIFWFKLHRVFLGLHCFGYLILC